MKILFLHRGFPGQFKYLVAALSQIEGYDITFITSIKDVSQKNVNVYSYTVNDKDLSCNFDLLKNYEKSIVYGQKAAQIMKNLKKEGYNPDIIIGHSWGNTLFVKDIYPEVPFLCYFEWYQNPDGAVEGFDKNLADENKKIQITCDNAYLMPDLCSCDAGLSPTQWQKEQFPKDFHHKIKVIHDGIDTQKCKPDDNAIFTISGKTFSKKDEIITYATRGMEPMRGFPQFMRAIEKVLMERENAHVIIAGIDKVFYGDAHASYKEELINELNLDMSRIHFCGGLNFDEYINLLQISSCHVYLTYPFVLSWSLIESMGCSCPLICSKTPPVTEVIKDNFNGILTDFFDVSEISQKIIMLLSDKKLSEKISQNARKDSIAKFDAKKLLVQHLAYINSVAKGENRL